MARRLFSLLFFALLILLGFTEERQVAWEPEKRKDRWTSSWYHRRHHNKKELAKSQHYDLVMLGDSITQGWEREGQKVWRSFYSSRKVLNLGFDGDRTEHLLWRLQNGAMDYLEPKCVTLMLGTNNAGKRLEEPEVTAKAISNILSILRERWPFCKIVLWAILPRGKDDADLVRSFNRRTNLLLQTYTDNQTIFWLDAGEHFVNKQGELKMELMPDYLHPNEKGYQILAEQIEPLLKKLLDD